MGFHPKVEKLFIVRKLDNKKNFERIILQIKFFFCAFKRFSEFLNYILQTILLSPLKIFIEIIYTIKVTLKNVLTFQQLTQISS
jgi:hypothetical protein